MNNKFLAQRATKLAQSTSGIEHGFSEPMHNNTFTIEPISLTYETNQKAYPVLTSFVKTGYSQIEKPVMGMTIVLSTVTFHTLDLQRVFSPVS